VHDLNDLVIGSPPVTIGSAHDISESGIILASGFSSSAGFVQIVLTPVDDEPIPGDLDGDGSVGVLDLLMLLAEWGPCDKPGDCPADLDNNNAVDVNDLLTLLASWG